MGVGEGAIWNTWDPCTRVYINVSHAGHALPLQVNWQQAGANHFAPFFVRRVCLVASVWLRVQSAATVVAVYPRRASGVGHADASVLQACAETPLPSYRFHKCLLNTFCGFRGKVVSC